MEFVGMYFHIIKADFVQMMQNFGVVTIIKQRN